MHLLESSELPPILELQKPSILSLLHAVHEVLEPDEALEAQEVISRAIQHVMDGDWMSGDELLTIIGKRVNFKASNQTLWKSLPPMLR